MWRRPKPGQRRREWDDDVDVPTSGASVLDSEQGKEPPHKRPRTGSTAESTHAEEEGGGGGGEEGKGEPVEEDEEGDARVEEAKRLLGSTDEQRGAKDPSNTYARVTAAMVHAFLRRSVPVDRDDAIERFMRKDPQRGWSLEQIMFRHLMTLTSRQIMCIWAFPQKSHRWLLSRFGRKTGSQGGTIIGWNPYENPLNMDHKNVYENFTSNEATDHGNKYENTAARAYLMRLQRELNLLYVMQKGYLTGSIVFRGDRIPLRKGSKFFAAPRARLWHLGQVVDPFNHMLGVSMDGLVTIEDIPLIVIEIKCPFYKDKALYTNEPMYYFPQPSDNQYTLWRYLPSVRSADRVTWSPVFGMVVDTYVLDPQWYLHWYSQRILRHHFGSFLPLLAISMKYRFRRNYPTTPLTPDTFIDFLNKTLSLDVFVSTR